MLTVVLNSDHQFIGLNAFLFVALILCCLLIGGVIHKYKLNWLPESAGCMIFGFICGVFLNLASDAEKNVVEFSPNLVWFVILPPIILDAGYSLKRKDFFHNFGTILMLAFIGTVVNNLIFGYMMYAFAKAGWIPLDSHSPLECLLFGAVVSATDPVATLAVLGSKEVGAHPLLYSLVFGESMLNDAVAIVLYKTFDGALPSPGAEGEAAEVHFGASQLFEALGTFLGVSIGSVVVGVGVALLCCFIFRKVDLSHFPVYEFTLVTLFAYLSYFAAEMAYLSGIMSIFFCSVCLAHYNFYNISTSAQVATQEAFKSIAQVMETFVFAYIGITGGLSIHTAHLQWSIPMIALTILSCQVARAGAVFPLCFLANLRRRGGWCRSQSSAPSAALAATGSGGGQIPFSMQIPLWFAGLRGSVAFALALHFSGEHLKYVVSSTLMLVLFTTIIGGGLTLPILRWTGNAMGDSATMVTPMADPTAHPMGQGSPQVELLEHSHSQDASAAGGPGRVVNARNLSFLREIPALAEDPSFKAQRRANRYYGLIGKFKKFDDQFMQQWFGGKRTARGKSRGILNEFGANMAPEDDPMRRKPSGGDGGGNRGEDDQSEEVKSPESAIEDEELEAGSSGASRRGNGLAAIAEGSLSLPAHPSFSQENGGTGPSRLHPLASASASVSPSASYHHGGGDGQATADDFNSLFRGNPASAPTPSATSLAAARAAAYGTANGADADVAASAYVPPSHREGNW